MNVIKSKSFCTFMMTVVCLYGSISVRWTFPTKFGPANASTLPRNIFNRTPKQMRPFFLFLSYLFSLGLINSNRSIHLIKRFRMIADTIALFLLQNSKFKISQHSPLNNSWSAVSVVCIFSLGELSMFT